MSGSAEPPCRCGRVGQTSGRTKAERTRGATSPGPPLWPPSGWWKLSPVRAKLNSRPGANHWSCNRSLGAQRPDGRSVSPSRRPGPSPGHLVQIRLFDTCEGVSEASVSWVMPTLCPTRSTARRRRRVEGVPDAYLQEAACGTIRFVRWPAVINVAKGT